MYEEDHEEEIRGRGEKDGLDSFNRGAKLYLKDGTRGIKSRFAECTVLHCQTWYSLPTIVGSCSCGGEEVGILLSELGDLVHEVHVCQRVHQSVMVFS